MPRERLKFGPQKYAAMHLLLSRWIRKHAAGVDHRYVTMGGTELLDVVSLNFVDPTLACDAVSYEVLSNRHALALESQSRLRLAGINITTSHANFFRFERADDRPHLFFIDLEGVFAWADYHMRVGDMLAAGTIREGDTLFVTSHLGHNPGWPKVFRTFDGEFRLLNASANSDKRNWYRKAHCSFTLYKALQYADLVDDVAIQPIGTIEYADTSPMGLFGFVLSTGATHFHRFVAAEDAPYYKPRSGTFERARG